MCQMGGRNESGQDGIFGFLFFPGEIKMTMAGIRKGKKWIEETTKRVATEYHRSIDNLKWRTRNKGVEDGMYSLVFLMGEIRYVEIFSEDDLSDLPKTPDMKVKVERRLRNLMNSTKSETGKRTRSYSGRT